MNAKFWWYQNYSLAENQFENAVLVSNNEEPVIKGDFS